MRQQQQADCQRDATDQDGGFSAGNDADEETLAADHEATTVEDADMEQGDNQKQGKDQKWNYIVQYSIFAKNQETRIRLMPCYRTFFFVRPL